MFKRSVLTLTLATTLSVSDCKRSSTKDFRRHYRMMLGDVEVTAISDGTTELPVHQLLQMDADNA